MSHSHGSKDGDGGILFGLILNSGYTVIEFVFGFLTGSLALIADASHNLTDTFTLSVSFVANRIARREADAGKTFGYGRATILAALLNASVMIAVASFIIFEAIQRLAHPQPVEGGVVAIVAAIGIAVNGSVAYVLSKRSHDLNMKSAFIDMAFDALSSLGAVIAGIVILLTGVNGIDSIVGLLIAALLLYNVGKIIREAVQILLEGTPKDIDVTEVTEAISRIKQIRSIDDLHAWTISSGYNALSCHIVIDEEQIAQSRVIVESVKSMLRKDFNIQHATIEVEFEASTSHKDHESH